MPGVRTALEEPAAERQADPGGAPAGREGTGFALLAAVQVMTNASVTVTSVSGPSIQRELRITHPDLVIVGAAYGLSFAGLLLLGSRLADLLGRRRVFTWGMTVFAVASVAAALAPGLLPLVAARFAQGCGAALAAPSAMALLGVVFCDEGRRRRAVAVWGSLSGLGAAAGMLLSGVVTTWGSWRWCLGLLALSAAVVALRAPYRLPEGPPRARTRVDLLGGLLATAGICLLGHGMNQVGTHGWSSPAAYWPQLGGLTLLLLFAVVEARARAPLLPLGLLVVRRRVTALLAAALGPTSGATTAFLLALYLQQVRGYSALQTSAAFVPYALVLLGAALLAGHVVERWGARAVLCTGLLAASGGLALLSRMNTHSSYTGPVLLGLLLLPLGIGLAVSSAVVLAVDGIPDHHAALAGGLVNTALLSGPTIGLALLVSLADAHSNALTAAGRAPQQATVGGYSFAFVCASCAFLAAAALAPLGLRRKQTR